MFTNPDEPLQIDAANNISIAYDGTTIVKDVDTGKLKSALTVDKPLEITNSTNLKLNIDSKTMDTTADGKLTTKQGIIEAGTGVSVVTNPDTKITTIAANIDNITITTDEAGKLKTHYDFLNPLNYNSTNGNVTLNVDNSTIVIDAVSGKLKGNYTANNGIQIS